jgi:hypothetical protein
MTEILDLFVTVTTPVIVALVIYYMNERAKRQDFKRNKEFDRKRDAYEKALSDLRGIHEVRSFMFSEKLVDRTLKDASNVSDIVSVSIMLYVRHLLLRRYSKYRPEVRTASGNKQGISDEEYEIIETLSSLTEDFDSAVGSLALIDTPPELMAKLKLVLALVVSEEFYRKETDTGFDTMITDVEHLMRDDLKMTIAGKVRRRA